MHEFRAGCLLFKSILDQVPGVTSAVYSNGWPTEATSLEGADAVIIYCDGGRGHPVLQGERRTTLGALAKKGVGIGFMHYGCEIPATNGGPEFIEWTGGYYEDRYSVNPFWSPDYQKFPDHPVARGVKPFTNRDEWYFNIRFDTNLLGYTASGALEVKSRNFTPVLVAKPSDQVRAGPYVNPRGPYEHVVAASGREEIMMWLFQRPDGGRGFGFTGGHTHAHWADDNQRKVVLNAMLWISKVEVPPNGVESKLPAEAITANLDPKGRR
jgi:hypothetical protein